MLSATNYDEKTCNAQCVATDGCTQFYVGSGTEAGKCYLYKYGCFKIYSNWKQYQKLDLNDMDSCSMVQHILKTNDT